MCVEDGGCADGERVLPVSKRQARTRGSGPDGRDAGNNACVTYVMSALQHAQASGIFAPLIMIPGDALSLERQVGAQFRDEF